MALSSQAVAKAKHGVSGLGKCKPPADSEVLLSSRECAAGKSLGGDLRGRGLWVVCLEAGSSH